MYRRWEDVLRRKAIVNIYSHTPEVLHPSPTEQRLVLEASQTKSASMIHHEDGSSTFLGVL